MNKKRTGFTMPEILLTLVIAGFIGTVAIQAINANKTAYTSLSYYAYENLKSAVAELIIPEAQGERLGDNGEGVYTHIIDGPYGEERLLIQERLFDGLCEIMNTQSVGKIDGKDGFTTLNGQQYTIDGITNDDPNAYSYTTITIDVNGTALPNSTNGSGSLPPDKISFAILDSGEVLPIKGTASADNITVNKRKYNYLSSRVTAFKYKNPDHSSKPYFCEKSGLCDYDKVYLLNGVSFRQAYCQSRIFDVPINNYCSGIEQHASCPPQSTDYDTCKQEVIKPVFRFNFG